MGRLLIVLGGVVVLSGCGVDRTDASKFGKVPGYLSSASCGAAHDATGCNAISGCKFLALGVACPAGTVCPAGACVSTNTCGQKSTQASCTAQAGCGWSAMGLVCPLGADCGANGYCHETSSSGGGCACASTLYCPATGA